MNICVGKIIDFAGKEWVLDSRRIKILFAGIIVLGLVLRLLRLAELSYLGRDEIFYIKSAEIWNQYGIAALYTEDFLIPPLFLYLMNLLIACGCSALVAGKMLSIFFGVLFIIPMYWIGKFVFNDPRAGLLVALLAAVNPFAIRASALILRDGANLTLAAAALAFACAAIVQRSRWSWCGAAFFCGLAILSRHESLCIPALFYIWFLYAFFHDRKNWLMHVKEVAIFTVVMVSTCFALFCIMGLPFSYIMRYFQKLDMIKF